eukprot:336442-Chlamydomonas_euryale.AAC.1
MFACQSLVNAVARHQLPEALEEVTPTLAIAFVNLNKAYDHIVWVALWAVLTLNELHLHVIKLLEDGRRRSYEWMVWWGAPSL